MPGLPNHLISPSAQSAYLNKMRDNARSLQPSESPGTLMSHTVHGTFYEATPPSLPPLAEESDSETPCY